MTGSYNPVVLSDPVAPSEPVGSSDPVGPSDPVRPSDPVGSSAVLWIRIFIIRIRIRIQPFF